jgi:RNA polymerase sigma-70 factor, ECF subfamily
MESTFLDDIDKKEIVRKLLSTIPEKFRIPLVLVEIDGMSYTEIAETLHISLNTTRTRIFRAREKLRKELIDMGWML